MYLINYKQREEVDVDMPGAEKITVRWLIGRQNGAKTYAMRRFEIKPGGIVPLHTHPEEHEIFVLSGEAKLLGSLKGTVAKKDDVIFIPSDEEHGYDNRDASESFCFICVIPLLDES